MTQLNLLPDVKLEYLRTNRTKRLVVGISIVAAIASLAVLILLASIVYVFQKKNLSDLNRDIATYNTQLKGTKDLDKILTIQNQLASLTKLHEDKPAASRLFGYLTRLTPTSASISQLDVDFVQKTMTITGKANGLDVANTYIDTLKFTTYQTVSADGTSEGTAKKAFSNIVLSQFARNASGATYTVTLSFDPIIFNNSSNVNLSVPKIISTRSSTEQPNALFQSTPEVKR